MPPRNIRAAQLLAFAVTVVMLGLGVAAAMFLPKYLPQNDSADVLTSENIEIKKFSSEAEFRSYLQEASQKQSGMSAFGSISQPRPEMALDLAPMELSDPSNFGRGSASNESFDAQIDRVSDTNVQVAGIDEPDIIKTNGQEIYYSNPDQFFILEDVVRSQPTELIDPVAPDIGRSIFPPVEQTRQTKIINAFPPESMSVLSEAIEEGGELLLDGDNLLILGTNKVVGFNVSDPTNPQKSWEYTFDESFLETARFLNGELILITRNYLSVDTPCPMPLMSNGIRIACTEIYHPTIPVPSDSLYTVVKLDPQFGDVRGKVSFVGSSGSSVVYVSPQSVYVSYSFTEDPVRLFTQFFSSEGGLLPSEYQQRLAQLGTYDISDQAKLVEYEQILAEYKATLSQDDRLKFEQEMNDRLKNFAQSRVREVEKTGIVKINTNNLEIAANGVVAGSPLNQFSMDEYAGNLRIATTVGQNSWLFPAESVNDLYVLNDKMETIGSLQNLAQNERIYSARFIGDTAYLVTFKQIDPFFVIDLSSPTAPKVAGELKIPGFSSYLHPLAENIILGVGQEEGQVKLSLFDVSNPSNPTEVNKYNMNEFWTEVQNNHHAFLQDEKHQVFFIPGGQGGYIFSYANNSLELVKTVADTGVQRALFINDYLYIVGRDQITVLNESDWSTVNTLSL